MSRTEAHKPWKYRTEDEKPQGGSLRGGKYMRILHSYGWPRRGKPIRKAVEHQIRQETKHRLNNDLDNYVDSKPAGIDWLVA